MDFAPVYLIQRFFYHLVNFFHHWYVDGSRNIGHRFVTTLEGTDQTLAIRITVRHFFEPLYRDYTIIGRILGVIFRTGRILIGGVIYALITLIFLLFYLAWIATPVLILFYAARGL